LKIRIIIRNKQLLGKNFIILNFIIEVKILLLMSLHGLKMKRPRNFFQIKKLKYQLLLILKIRKIEHNQEF
jgi:hypothetical protein